MKITQIQTVHQLTFLPRMFPVNCYLVEEEHELTLIDAALPYSAAGIMKAAKRIGKPITRIVFTHAHDDHTGAIDSLKQTLTDIPVYISARDARLLHGDLSLDPDEPDSPIRGGVSSKLKTRADILMNDGDHIGSLLAIAAPGHTPGLMAFLDTRNHALIVGDALQTRGGIAVAGQVRPLFPFPAWGTWNKQVALSSAIKLRQHAPTLLATGHGRMLLDPVVSMDHAITVAASALR
jgi:glyoxylase-like metal-dependent hydrolase (beta-lactamase superfamily II)